MARARSSLPAPTATGHFARSKTVAAPVVTAARVAAISTTAAPRLLPSLGWPSMPTISACPRTKVHYICAETNAEVSERLVFWF